MSLRLEETFELIEAELSDLGLLERLRAGVFICGGGARIPGIQALAENIFQLPAFPGKTNSISGLKSALDQPEFATAIGLVKFGSLQQKRKPAASLAGGIKKTFAEIFQKVTMNNAAETSAEPPIKKKIVAQGLRRGRRRLQRRRPSPRKPASASVEFLAVNTDAQALDACAGPGQICPGRRPHPRAWAPAATPNWAAPPPRRTWRNSAPSAPGPTSFLSWPAWAGAPAPGAAPVFARVARESGALVLAAGHAAL